MRPRCQSSAIAHNSSDFIYHAAATPPLPPRVPITCGRTARQAPADPLTVYRSQDDPGVVVRDDVGVAVFGLVDFQVRMLPGELLTGVDGLEPKTANARRHIQWVMESVHSVV